MMILYRGRVSWIMQRTQPGIKAWAFHVLLQVYYWLSSDNTARSGLLGWITPLIELRVSIMPWSMVSKLEAASFCFVLGVDREKIREKCGTSDSKNRNSEHEDRRRQRRRWQPEKSHHRIYCHPLSLWRLSLSSLAPAATNIYKKINDMVWIYIDPTTSRCQLSHHYRYRDNTIDYSRVYQHKHVRS